MVAGEGRDGKGRGLREAPIKGTDAKLGRGGRPKTFLSNFLRGEKKP